VDSYNGPAVLREGDADVEVGRLAFSTFQPGEFAQPGWRGQFDDPTPEHALEPGEALLILPSGEQGNIIITEYSYRLVGAGYGTFDGTGPPPSLPSDNG